MNESRIAVKAVDIRRSFACYIWFRADKIKLLSRCQVSWTKREQVANRNRKLSWSLSDGSEPVVPFNFMSPSEMSLWWFKFWQCWKTPNSREICMIEKMPNLTNPARIMKNSFNVFDDNSLQMCGNGVFPFDPPITLPVFALFGILLKIANTLRQVNHLH